MGKKVRALEAQLALVRCRLAEADVALADATEELEGYRQRDDDILASGVDVRSLVFYEAGLTEGRADAEGVLRAARAVLQAHDPGSGVVGGFPIRWLDRAVRGWAGA